MSYLNDPRVLFAAERTLLAPEEIPSGYRLHMPTALNATVAVAGAALLAFLLLS